MTKPATTQLEQTGTKPIDKTQTINGAWTFKGEEKEVMNIGIEFINWCKEMEEKYNCNCLTMRSDYNNYALWDRTRT